MNESHDYIPLGNKILKDLGFEVMLGYRIKLTPDDNGTLLVTCPALPEVTTFGENREDAMRHAVDAIEEALAARIARGAEVPPPANSARNTY